jgi:CubicO group peptidase (beta-lactamase class C family)
VAVFEHQLCHRRRIVEKITGKPYMEFLTQHIFRPLGMKSVWNSDEVKLTQADATAYYRHALGPCAKRPRRGADGCLPRANWP